MISKTQKNAIDLAISLNPSQVVTERTTVTEKDGAFERATVTLPEQTMLLFPKMTGKRRHAEIGEVAESMEWVALAPSTADVLWGTGVHDVCVVEGVGRLEIQSGRPLMVGTDVNGYELTLKLVK